MINLDYLNIYIIVPSTIFFYCLFNGYFNINYIKGFLHSYPLIGTFLKLLGWIFLICLVLYLLSDTVYAMAPGYSGSNTDLPKGDVKITTGDVSNSLTIKDSTINIPDIVARGLTNLGTGTAIAAGITGASSIATKAGSSPMAKLGIIATGGVIGAVSVVLANGTNLIAEKKIDNAMTLTGKSDTLPISSTSAQGSISQTTTSNTGNGNSGDGPAAFSIEPGADFDTVMSLLEANNILHICILYLPTSLMILYLSTMIVENQWNLIWIKNIFGNWFYNLIIKFLSYTGKYNRIWMFIGWVLLVFASLVALYISNFLVNNLDIISEIIQKGK
uniref:hypothetical protein n=1 Tax=Epichloe bromicola TaxID=79588 RepID=UPI00226CA325|nr:hypothetical protein OYW92_mgp09 [Epichloe bromicola]UYX62215.1 hypothetical protein [Epichloe bromicola]